MKSKKKRFKILCSLLSCITLFVFLSDISFANIEEEPNIIDNDLDYHPFYDFDQELMTVNGIYEGLPIKNFKEDFPKDYIINIYRGNNQVNNDNNVIEKDMIIEIIHGNINYGQFNVDKLISSNIQTRANSFGYTSPLKNLSPSEMTSGYGWRYLEGWGNDFHRGVDFGRPQNTIIRATKAGTVVYSGWAIGGSNDDGGGYLVRIDHGGGIQTVYCHMNSQPPVTKNQNVTQGQTIGYVGTTGSSTGYHLHYEARINGVHTNPSSYLSYDEPSTTPPYAKPKLSNIKVSNIDHTGYTITADISNVKNVSHVLVAAWTSYNGTDDLAPKANWPKATINGNKVTYRVKISDHNFEAGEYQTHFNLYEKNNTQTTIVAQNTIIPGLYDAEVIDADQTGYTVSVKITDPKNAQYIEFPSWSLYNGRDDLGTWPRGTINGDTATYRVNTSDHNDETGKYETHIYLHSKTTTRYVYPKSMIALVPELINIQIKDVNRDGYTVEADVVNVNKLNKVIVATWTTLNGQDDLKPKKDWPEAIIDGSKISYRVKTSNHNNELGEYQTHLYFTDIYGAETGYAASNVNVNFVNDIQITDIDQTGYTISGKIDNIDNISSIKFPTWTLYKGQDDLKKKVDWPEGTINGNTVTYRVNTSDHNNEGGKYQTHIYMYDKAGKEWKVPISEVEVPQFYDIEIKDVDSTGYTVSAKITNKDMSSKITMPVWTTKDWQDDLIWHTPTISGNTLTYRVQTKEHKNESGEYQTHLYYYDKENTMYRYQVENVLVPSKPSVSNIDIIDVDHTGYTLVVTIDNMEEVSSVTFPTWTLYKGQDDLKKKVDWPEGTINGNKVTYRVNTSDHNNEGGKYQTHIYVNNIHGSSTAKAVDIVEVPQFYDIEIKDVDSTGYTVSAKITNKDMFSKVTIPVWTTKNWQDDLIWHTPTISGNTLTYRVQAKDHKNESGEYQTHLYYYDKENTMYRYQVENVVVPSKPSVSNIDIVDVDHTGYTVVVTIDNMEEVSSITFPTWTLYKGQDDLKKKIDWPEGTINGNKVTYRVNTSDHNNEGGKYQTHIYVNNIHGSSTAKAVDIVEVPQFYDIEIKDVDSTGYTVSAKITNKDMFSKVTIPVWTTKNWQDDLIWHTPTISGNTLTYRVQAKDHKNESGEYQTHLYYYDKENTMYRYQVENVVIPLVRLP
ncbi:murein DD-endopeptidase MepM/ murein hydrolase activator NlpD/stage V sporulation protein SpoVS [Breznakia sp. PF5-3]|uniref:GBS Bsp-like repeat-containing protein n=1 Tax=unclassified Breznakia TaxID=2623764 RepID=UPI00240711C2|nr:MULTISPECIES: GBS Bsp-like repeat-containing protein [unclassified Breznakia]MDF9825847.1 murein DD-endopeptidase MepM/ murein hydrolase activator NlpD/stage V sporulation protein SpoVS [Breznakia sp. PM6-1]MDF9835339.1 murein DD-endopeptidase MepM/ murein hydrolase activator NlpD/stage V sporulation protein SpoVS [Breznakia sp. PF5-3]